MLSASSAMLNKQKVQLDTDQVSNHAIPAEAVPSAATADSRVKYK